MCGRRPPPSHPEVISLDPLNLDEVLGDLVRLGAAVDEPERGIRLRSELEERLRVVSDAVDGATRPRVAALEWLDPPFIGGHWVPEMVELAGGADVLGTPGLKSRTVAWGAVADAEADVAVLMPCGLYVQEAAEQAIPYRERLRDLRARVVAVDAASSFSRPGPRLVDGMELLAHILHPELVAAPPGLGWQELAWASPRPRAPLRRARARPQAGASSGTPAEAAASAPAKASTPSTAMTPISAKNGRGTRLRSNQETISAAMAPPIRPPMWPPMLIFGTENVNTRLMST